ncbi:MAG: IclR family transcriptional regulator, partial [Pyrobaculum sp.]
MFVLLNLTAPPILMLLLPAAFIGNYSLPAPPASDVAVFSTAGEPLPAWVLNSTLYVLQDGSPAVAVYVPKFENASGLYTVAVNASSLVVQAPPGVMVEGVSPTPLRVDVNKTGMYLYLQGPATVKYVFFSVEVRPPRTTTPPVAT